MQKTLIKILFLFLLLVFALWLCIYIGFDITLKTLIIIMIMDYLMGLSLALQGNSKHGQGVMSSTVGFIGITKKITILVLVALAALLDAFLINYGISLRYLKDIAIMAFVINEMISIIENANAMGLQLPKIFMNAIEFIRQFKIKKK